MDKIQHLKYTLKYKMVNNLVYREKINAEVCSKDIQLGTTLKKTTSLHPSTPVTLTLQIDHGIENKLNRLEIEPKNHLLS